MLMVVAPSLITASSTRQRKSRSERLPSSGENSTSGQAFLAKRTASLAASSTCSGVMRSFFSMCSALVAMKTWTRQALAPFSHRWRAGRRGRWRGTARNTVESFTALATARTARSRRWTQPESRPR